MKSSFPIFASDVDVRIACHKCLHNISVAVIARSHQGGVPIGPGPVNVRPCFHQMLHNLGVAVLCSNPQRGHT
eukprot:CAMPEP_0117759842 /NCGR_PEP_ID=MMETSP0947-20121206/16247_1 /TAXON_ID=44440 /ORGANISM="Chattonella subsalsa, Strain CCMP2191" /LENGTH=72 /DNA_ID=CAMNT_0005580363 /DNA_START=376 /DNA_END=594 /DNA_ORIENTATION=-